HSFSSSALFCTRSNIDSPLYLLVCLFLCAYNSVRRSFPTRRSSDLDRDGVLTAVLDVMLNWPAVSDRHHELAVEIWWLLGGRGRSEEHTSELQSRENLVCRLLLEK